MKMSRATLVFAFVFIVFSGLTAFAPESAAGEFLYAPEGNRLHVIDLEQAVHMLHTVCAKCESHRARGVSEVALTR